MGRAYLAFAQEQPHLYFVIFSAARAFEGSGDVDRGAAFDALVAATATVIEDNARSHDVAIALWASLHGYATLTQTVTPYDFPAHDRYVSLLLDAYL